VGSALLRELESRCLEMRAYELVSNVREEAIPLYKSVGYEIRDEGTTLYGSVKSFAMFKRLT
jgi:ribosomal protein S18 acetylase RimI-like enzyme